MKKCFNCSEKKLSAYLDNELEAAAQLRVREHLSGCSVCQQVLAQMQRVRAHVQGLPSIKLSEEFDVSFKSALLLAAQEKKQGERVRQKPVRAGGPVLAGWSVWGPVAAVLVLAVALFFGGKELLFSSSAPYVASLKGEVWLQQSGQEEWKLVRGSIPLKEGDWVRTGENGEALIEAKKIYQARLLPESEWTPVQLAAAAKPDDAIDFKLKKGNLIVQTGKEFAGRKMFVSGPSAKATVVGTTFMVRALPDGSSTLSVEEGKVQFSGRETKQSGAQTWVGRFESSRAALRGNPQSVQPMTASEFHLFAAAKPEMLKNPTTEKLVALSQEKKKLTQNELDEWQNRLLQESDLELASFGLYLLGEMEQKVMAPAEALQQYVSVLTYFPDAVESIWAFEFLRDKLSVVPEDRELLEEEAPAKDYAQALEEAASEKGISPTFLKGIEPQRKFLTSEFEVKTKEGVSYWVERSLTFERDLGEKNFRAIGYLDAVRAEQNGDVLLRVGKLFTYKSETGGLSKTNTAVFHPDGKLIYTLERDFYYHGRKAIGYAEVYKNADGKRLAKLTRRIQNWNRANQPTHYQELVENSEGKTLLSRKRSNIAYAKEGNVADFQEEVVDVENRLAYHSGKGVPQSTVAKARLVSRAATFESVDEVMRRLP
jgi:hypothetical protein